MRWARSPESGLAPLLREPLSTTEEAIVLSCKPERGCRRGLVRPQEAGAPTELGASCAGIVVEL